MKKKLIFGALVIILALVIITLWAYRVWPFSAASNTPAFLGTTFGMSLPEAQRALKSSGIQLVDKETFKMLDPKISKKVLFGDEFELVLAEDKIRKKETESWYMPSIEIFKSQVSAKFTFERYKLCHVEVSIFPFTIKNSDHIVEAITNKLTSAYKLVKKEVSKEVPGAYHLKFKGNLSSVNLWVNIINTAEADPIINLYISYDKADFRQREIFVKKRETITF